MAWAVEILLTAQRNCFFCTIDSTSIAVDSRAPERVHVTESEMITPGLARNLDHLRWCLVLFAHDSDSFTYQPMDISTNPDAFHVPSLLLEARSFASSTFKPKKIYLDRAPFVVIQQTPLGIHSVHSYSRLTPTQERSFSRTSGGTSKFSKAGRRRLVTMTRILAQASYMLQDARRPGITDRFREDVNPSGLWNASLY
ncbi:hypothetical protein BDZ97DRAFT_1757318 [Flammula alnicola]|nr:hypothetical protein BDZ97DRAFT_1757318 [Flammula alnicola]